MLDSTLIVTREFRDSISMFFDQKLIRDIGLPPNRKKILRKPLFDMKNTRFRIHESDSISRGGHIIREPLKLQRKRISRGLIGDFSHKDDKYNVFETTKLGWINCDRFVRSKKRKVKYKLKIKNADGVDVKMVFKSVSSILPSKKYNNDYDFGKVPIDEDVTIIAIKEKDGKHYLSIQDDKTKAKPNIEFNFKEVTIEELKSELETLNNTFN